MSILYWKQLYAIQFVSCMTCVTTGEETANSSRAPEFTPDFCAVRVFQSLVFYFVFCRSLFVLSHFCFYYCASLVYGY